MVVMVLDMGENNMGMYTELVLKIEVSKKIDESALNIFKYLFCNNNVEPTVLPDHPFFKCKRWRCVGKSCSFYHHPETINSWAEYEYSPTIRIFSRSDLKNYDNEIDLFLDWASPYFYNSENSVVGWKWYEEDETPTLIRKSDAMMKQREAK